MDDAEFDAALIDQIKQRAFELVIADHADPKTLREIFSLLLKARDQELDEKAVRAILSEEVRKVNHMLVKYKYIRRFDVRTEEFVKTTTKKIKRFLVKKA